MFSLESSLMHQDEVTSFYLGALDLVVIVFLMSLYFFIIHLFGSLKGPFKVPFQSLYIFMCGGCGQVLCHHQLYINGEHGLASIHEKKWFKATSSGPCTVADMYKLASCPGHFSLLSGSNVPSIEINVELKCSHWPLLCGWYGTV